MSKLDTLDPRPLTDDKSRAIALATGHLLALDEAAALTDMPSALGKIDHYRSKVQQYLRWVTDDECGGSTALGMLGPYGYGPGIEAACRAAKFHGFDWCERASAMRAASKADVHGERVS